MIPLRLRVALAFALTTAISLLGLGFFVYLRVQDGLEEHLDDTLEAELEAVDALPSGERADAVSRINGEAFAQWFAPDGTLVAASARAPEPVEVDLPEDGSTERNASVALVDDDGESEHEASALVLKRYDDGVLLVGTPREDTDETLEELRSQLLIGGIAALLAASGLGYLVAAGGLRPIDRMRQQAATISSRSAHERLPLPAAKDELHRLGATLNAMLDRLEEGLVRERRFVAEAGHELRTPLSLLRLEIDLALRGSRSNEELAAALASAGDEVDRLTALAEDLLALATSGDGRLALATSDSDVGALLDAVAARFATRAAQDGRELRVEHDAARASVDAARLDQLISNLLDNALRHGRGTVYAAARRTDTGVDLTVRDDGDGPGDAEPGVGLSIVRAIAHAHGGHVTTGDGVRVSLPR